MVTKELILKEFIEASAKYRNLLPPERLGNGFLIKGSIDVIDDNDQYWDTYDVNIFIPELYPSELPILQETSKKI